jgi:ADP-L-glycero-D-manno-heptose 6-epimerase
MIIITGAAGFIGSALLAFLNEKNFNDIVLVDHFTNEQKLKNLAGKKYSFMVNREEFHDWLDIHHSLVQFVFHLGARTDTAEFDLDLLNRLNLNFSKKVFEQCTEYGLPLVYASSAATYGDGALGFDDDESICPQLHPLNPYGVSKNEMDKWVLRQPERPYFWAGLKFFNVYGPNEYHKKRMASVIYHSYHQIKNNGEVKLFRSHRPEYADGQQLRDFIYVKDVCKVCYFFMKNRSRSGIYNLGTGEARSFLDLTNSVFLSMNLKPVISFIDIPEDIRNKYQYYTRAKMEKLRRAGFTDDFTSLEAGISDYVKNYLLEEKYY